MKNFIKIAGVIAMVAVIGLSFIGCFGSGGSGGGNSGGSRSSGTASVIPASDFKYELSADGKGVKLLEYIGPGGNIIIPTEIEGLPIVEIGRDMDGKTSLEFSNVTSVVIPDYYLPIWQEWVENDPFPEPPFWFNPRENILESVTFPKGIKIVPHGYLSSNAVKTFTIPDTVTEIHSYAFADSGLTSIVIPEGVTRIGSGGSMTGTFSGCKELKSVTLPESIREIVDSAFGACSNLETVNLPSHQIYFSEYAFEGCTKLSLATQQAIRNAGYTGTFN